MHRHDDLPRAVGVRAAPAGRRVLAAGLLRRGGVGGAQVALLVVVSRLLEVLRVGEVEADLLELVVADRGEAADELVVELRALLHHVQAVQRRDAHAHAHVAPLLGTHARRRGEAGAVALDDVARLAGDRGARDRDLTAVERGDDDALAVARGEERPQEAEEQARPRDADRARERVEVGVVRDEGARLRRPWADPRQAEGGEGAEADEAEDDEAQPLEPTHGDSPRDRERPPPQAKDVRARDPIGERIPQRGEACPPAAAPGRRRARRRRAGRRAWRGRATPRPGRPRWGPPPRPPWPSSRASPPRRL